MYGVLADFVRGLGLVCPRVRLPCPLFLWAFSYGPIPIGLFLWAYSYGPIPMGPMGLFLWPIPMGLFLWTYSYGPIPMMAYSYDGLFR